MDVVADIRDAPSAIDLEMEDAKYEGTGWRMLEVRKGWARVAVACDILLTLGIGVVAAAIFANPVEEAAHVASAEVDASLWISTVLSGVLIWFIVYAHKKATQPRKPKRAWVPAFLRTNA